MCLNQFHDVIPGSSIEIANIDARAIYARIEKQAAALLDDAVGRIIASAGLAAVAERRREFNGFAVFNGLSFAREEIVEISCGPISLSTQQSAGGNTLAIVRATPLSLSYTPVGASACQEVSAKANDGGFIMENGSVRVNLGSGARIRSFVLNASGREAIAQGSQGNIFRMYEDIPLFWDAWDVQIYHLQKSGVLDFSDCAGELIEAGPLRAAVRFSGMAISDKSTISQTVYLYADSDRLEFDLEVDWHESHKFLKVEFPLSVHSPQATYEMAYGHLERPTHENTSVDIAKFEVCGHRWADLSEYGFGVALMTDCKYGYACHSNVLRLSLLRAPKGPDGNADMHSHRIKYALLPHAGTFQSAGVIRQAHAFNNPLVARAVYKDDKARLEQPLGRAVYKEVGGWRLERMPPIVTSSTDQVVIDCVKRAEDGGDVIIRAYESFGGSCVAQVGLGSSFSSAIETNILEDEGERKQLQILGSGAERYIILRFRAFEIKTVKLQL